VNHSSFYRRHRRDSTHPGIAKVLLSFGFSVKDTSKLGDDYPDMVVGLAGITDMVEAKSVDGELSDGQSKFAKNWRGAPIVVLKSEAEAIEWATRTRHERRRTDAPKQIGGVCRGEDVA
jgi:hypothetical protein